ncbi:MAG TPA: CHRD domain-containing protein [Archangium sp.]|jgi:hypothetical protein|uniref:CHRD domain-containing protein n=1 Tax=Archangium sp. TaxID=1872627 RepID=UPI002ED91E55
MNMRDMKRSAVRSLVGAGLLMLVGCGQTYVATSQLSGASEAPNPVTTSAAGTSTATLDGNELTVTGGFNGLQSDLMETAGSSAHVHRGASGTAGPIVFNLTVTSTDKRNGTFTGTKSLSNEEEEDFKNGLYYVNVHTANNPSGEIRGQFVPLVQD